MTYITSIYFIIFTFKAPIKNPKTVKNNASIIKDTSKTISLFKENAIIKQIASKNIADIIPFKYPKLQSLNDINMPNAIDITFAKDINIVTRDDPTSANIVINDIMIIKIKSIIAALITEKDTSLIKLLFIFPLKK